MKKRKRNKTENLRSYKKGIMVEKKRDEKYDIDDSNQIFFNNNQSKGEDATKYSKYNEKCMLGIR